MGARETHRYTDKICCGRASEDQWHLSLTLKRNFFFKCGLQTTCKKIIWVIIIITETEAKSNPAFLTSSSGTSIYILVWESLVWGFFKVLFYLGRLSHSLLRSYCEAFLSRSHIRQCGRGQRWAKNYIGDERNTSVYLPLQCFCGREMVGKVRMPVCNVLQELGEWSHAIVGGTECDNEKLPKWVTLPGGRKGAWQRPRNLLSGRHLKWFMTGCISTNSSTVFLVLHALLEPYHSLIKT